MDMNAKTDSWVHRIVSDKRSDALVTRRKALLGGTAALACGPAIGQAAEAMSLADALWAMVAGDRAEYDRAMAAIAAHEGAALVPALILAQRFSRYPSAWFEPQLQRLAGTGEPQGWFEWMLWQEANDQIIPHSGYAAFKRRVFLRIDPNFEVFLKPRYLRRDKMKIRLEEITWGGVAKDGIPSLDNPDLIEAAKAHYLKPGDLVFGVSINGDARAYPLRIMGWHEMFNDVIGGVPLALAYCTLCGSGILFETKVKGRAKPFVFGSSGFLYRSNKLMFDRQTHSLWNQFTGAPVVGPLVGSGIVLKQRPVVITPWQEWVARNPQTRVLSLNTGHSRNYGSGVVYSDYFASADLMFPTHVDQSLLRQKDYVFGIRQFGAAKAWPLSVFAGGQVINDTLGGRDLVLVGDFDGRTVRAYLRNGRVFRAAAQGVADETGAVWTATEEALTAPTGETLPRVAGHIAYWFAWSGYLGDVAELYAP